MLDLSLHQTILAVSTDYWGSYCRTCRDRDSFTFTRSYYNLKQRSIMLTDSFYINSSHIRRLRYFNKANFEAAISFDPVFIRFERLADLIALSTGHRKIMSPSSHSRNATKSLISNRNPSIKYSLRYWIYIYSTTTHGKDQSRYIRVI